MGATFRSRRVHNPPLYHNVAHLQYRYIGLERCPTFCDELGAWYGELREFSHIFSQNTGSSGYSAPFTYNVHLWTIPVEFRGSMISYCVLLATCKSSAKGRLWCQIILIVYFLFIIDVWYGAMFVSRMLLCDSDVKCISAKGVIGRQGLRTKQCIYWGLLILGLFLAGVPHVSNTAVLGKNPGWYYLSLLKPGVMVDQKWFYLFWSSTLVIAAIPHIPLVKSFLETPTIQYLGRNSFGLYLIHGPLLWTIGDRLYVAAGWRGGPVNGNGIANQDWGLNIWPPSKLGPLGLEVSFLIPFLFLLLLNLRLAEIVTGVIDVSMVKFGKWLYQKALPSSVP